MNIIYTEGLFNSVTKERYLKNMNEHTRRSNERIFKIAALLENTFVTDLYNFNLAQLKQLLMTMNSSVLSTLTGAGNRIKNYIQWAIEQDLRTDNINPLDAMTSREWFEGMVDKSEATLFSEQKINELVSECVNFQDKALIRGIYEGLGGRQFSELLNAKLEHIVKKGSTIEITLFDDGDQKNKGRKMNISYELYILLQKAAKETKYLKNNGVVTEGMKSYHSLLCDNDFIIRTARDARGSENESAPSAMVNRRLKRISKTFDLLKLTPINIRNSGMLNMAKDFYIEHGQINKKDYLAICEHYNVGKGKVNISRLRLDFLNEQNIKLIYGVH